MQRCLQLAQKGFGKASPNPMVGCVIVHEYKIIGEGYHSAYGGPHAEPEALRSVTDKSLLPASTVYVSLEPCAHYGKTPPCAPLLVESGVRKVVIGALDPYHEVDGRGVQILKQGGVEVVTGVLRKECEQVNKRFMTYHIHKRPYIILKWAETSDGFIAGEERKQISGKAAQILLHQWRTEEDAFMVGTNTLLQDDPRLNARYWPGKNPTRVAIDMSLRSDGMKLHFYDGSQDTMILNNIKDGIENNIQFVRIGDSSPQSIASALYEKRIQSVVIEGGADLLNSFIAQGLYDEIRVFKSKRLYFGKGRQAPISPLPASATEDLDEDELILYYK